jgi:hypothetical protein
MSKRSGVDFGSVSRRKVVEFLEKFVEMAFYFPSWLGRVRGACLPCSAESVPIWVTFSNCAMIYPRVHIRLVTGYFHLRLLSATL